MPDARGHGNSSDPVQGYSYDNLVTDTLSLIETLELSAPVLIGQSMGGMPLLWLPIGIPNEFNTFKFK